MEQNFAFCKWVPYVVKTNSVCNKLKIYANTSFVFPLSKKSYDFSEALIVPPSERQKAPKGAEIRYFCTFLYTLLKDGSSRVRVSGGHLCEAEAPTEPTGETADPYDNIITDTYYKFGVILTIY